MNEQVGENHGIREFRRGQLDQNRPTFIQNANWRVFEHDTCDCHSLLLASAVLETNGHELYVENRKQFPLTHGIQPSHLSCVPREPTCVCNPSGKASVK